MKTLLIANRCEIAVRIARTAAEMGLSTVAIFSEDDAAALHVKKTDAAVALSRGRIVVAGGDNGNGPQSSILALSPLTR